MNNKVSGALILLALVIACGVSPAATVTPSPTGAGAGPLFALLERTGTTDAYGAIAIVGLDGQVRARATFTPMPVPALGCIGAIVPAAAHVAAGKAFYADDQGVIRSLSTDGKIAVAATIPITSPQQMLSFAVSPDGATILATVFRVPKDATACDGSGMAGQYTLDAYSASRGAAGRLLYSQGWSTSPTVLALTGWDSLGPIGTYPTVWASQGGGPGSTLGVFVRVDASTMKVLAPFSDPSVCRVWSSVPRGSFVCTRDAVTSSGGTAAQSVQSPVSVRAADGKEIWSFTVTAVNEASSPILAPDERHFTICCADVSAPQFAELMVGQDGSHVSLAAGFTAQGWVDSTTMVGTLNSDPLKQPPFPLAYVVSGAPAQAVPMALTGDLVGTLGT